MQTNQEVRKLVEQDAHELADVVTTYLISDDVAGMLPGMILPYLIAAYNRGARDASHLQPEAPQHKRVLCAKCGQDFGAPHHNSENYASHKFESNPTSGDRGKGRDDR